jgi:hypothetical protein
VQLSSGMTPARTKKPAGTRIQINLFTVVSFALA